MAQGREEWFLILSEHFIPKALAPFQAGEGDLAIYVLARNSGEGTDRFDAPGDYQLTEDERAFLVELSRHYPKLVLLLNIGGVIDASSIKALPGISAVMLISQSGNIGGHIVADVLTGKSFPSGRLTDTWAARYSDYPSSAEFSHNNNNCDEEYYKDGIFVGYRYFDTFHVTPVYPFGYGLNYTNFSMQTVHVDANEERVTLAVRVTNTGTHYPGREIVQIYGSAPRSGLEKPMQVLVAFGKTRLLAPGESQTLEISFPLTNLESYSPEKAAYVLEKGEYLIRVGKHSRATAVAAVLVLDMTAVTKKVCNICPLDQEFEEITTAGSTPWVPERENSEKAVAPVFLLKASNISAVTVSYSREPLPYTVPEGSHTITLDEVRTGKYTIEQLVAQLTVEEMADLCVGSARDNSSVIGAASNTVPGAAGDTSVRLASRGVRDMTNADGPAGLRLTPHFRVDAEGNLLPGGKFLSDMEEVMPQRQPGEIDYYQYCTAVPIAWLLGSSWDMELIEQIGDIIGQEMEQFGIRIWLAPGMNIHRNPLCGRNFEYYSEDPLLSGLCAASMVRGVQRHPGLGTCIKHFFANNQEDNRMFLNAHIKERAIREIYLRNFGICIQAAQPMTIMTSYNLINGVHAANCTDAISRYARDECGFAGYVMTDWFSSHDKVARAMLDPAVTPAYSSASSPLCVMAGNDVQMPGSEDNIRDIIEAVEDGSLPIGYLQHCAARILNVDGQCSSFEDAPPYGENLPRKAFVSVREVPGRE